MKVTVNWKRDLGAVLIIAAFYAGLMVMGITCPIKFVTGVSCLGCGMTRAWLSALRLDWAGAVAFHPLFWLPVPAVGLFLLRKRLPRWLVWTGGGAICGAFCVVYLTRLLSGADPVVVWSPEEGLICRLWTALMAVV